jgi:cell division protein FtsI/penicillin-binding protein 2
MNPNSRSRCALVCTVFIGLFSIFSFRLIYLQAVKHDEYAGLAAKKTLTNKSFTQSAARF